ncbi:hypothetical protein J8J40_31975, partial [Mycobacterium tuberculosis]|nr:hypothetical protein [Mycobacterium tuberculosis]
LFATETWLLADADGRDPRSTDVAGSWRCDAGGCEAEAGTPARPAAIILLRDRADLPVDCRRAAVLVSAVPLPRACAETTLVLD